MATPSTCALVASAAALIGCGSEASAPGASMAAATHTDYAWNRLTRTVDLTSVTAADKPTLRTQLLWSTEEGYDHALLEAHTVGADDWTTLPDTGGPPLWPIPTGAGLVLAGTALLAVRIGRRRG